MSGLGRDEAPFNPRVWQEIDRTIATVRAANCTARRFLEIDGPYGPGLTSVAGDEGWLPPASPGADFQRWSVQRPPARGPGAEPDRVTPGTYMVRGTARPVPLIASEFEIGFRGVEAFETLCQPLDLCRATVAARDVALEEERLLYYGLPDDPVALLRVVPVPVPLFSPTNTTPVSRNFPIPGLHQAIQELAARGYAGPYALVVEPRFYTELYLPVAPAPPVTVPVLFIDLLRNLFRAGIYMAPVIDPAQDQPPGRLGAIITAARAYSRLVVGQDWLTTYRGRDGVLYRFLIMDSLQLQVCDPLSIQVLVQGEEGRREEGRHEEAGEAALASPPPAERARSRRAAG